MVPEGLAVWLAAQLGDYSWPSLPPLWPGSCIFVAGTRVALPTNHVQSRCPLLGDHACA